MTKRPKEPLSQAGRRPVSADEAEAVGLDGLKPPEADPDEVQQASSGDPEQDSPADDAVLEQEELYEGISSESLPSGKQKRP